MKDPKPLLRGEATPLERLLLEASARERPPSELVSQTRTALGLPSASPLPLRDALSSWGPKVLVALAGAALVGTLAHRGQPVVTPVAAPSIAAAPKVVPPTNANGNGTAAEAPTLSIDALPVAPAEPSHAAS